MALALLPFTECSECIPTIFAGATVWVALPLLALEECEELRSDIGKDCRLFSDPKKKYIYVRPDGLALATRPVTIHI
jgi:hypothetical protein